MKKFLVLTCFLCISITAFSQSSINDNARNEAVYKGNKQLIESGKYQFAGDWVMADNERQAIDEASNNVFINRGRVSVVLNHSAGETLSMAGMMNDYTANFDDENQQITISFSVDGHSFLLEIKSSQKSFLSYDNNGTKIVWNGKVMKPRF